MATLSEINETLKEQSGSLERIDKNLDTFLKAQRRSRLQAVETQIEGSRLAGASAGASGGSGGAGGAAARGGLLGGLLGGGLARGLAGAAAGGLAMAGALGLALPAFFGGLMAGEAGLDWLSSLGASFNFDSLKAAAIGFSDIIVSMDPKAFVVLAGIMAVSAVGGRRAAMGIGTMGIAISAFLGGLLAGEAIFDGFSLLGANYNFDSLKQVMVGFSDAILGLTPAAAASLAAIMGVGGFAAMRARNPLSVGAGMAAMSAGIAGFFGGLLLTEGALDLAISAGAALNFDALSTVFAGFSSAIESLSPGAITALGAIIASATGLAAFRRFRSPSAALGLATIMTGIGAGIGGLMFGLSLGDAGITWLQDISGATGDGLVSAFQMFNDSIGVLSEPSMIALGAIIAAGTGLGALLQGSGVTAGLGIFGIMTGIGAGIAGLFTGLAIGGKIVDLIEMIPAGDGDGFTSIFRQFSNSIMAITPEAIERISQLRSIGGFDIAATLGGLSAGVVALFGAEGLVGLGQSIRDGALGAIDWVFGTNLSENNRPSVFQQLVDSLAPLEDFRVEPIERFNAAMLELVEAFGRLNTLSVDENLGANVSSALASVDGAFGLSAESGAAAASRQALSLKDLYTENIIVQGGAGQAPVVINNVDNSSRSSSNTRVGYNTNLSPYDTEFFLRRNITPPYVGR